MNHKKRYIIILIIVFGYIILQFMAWEIMFVRKTSEITELKQKLIELSSTNSSEIRTQISELNQKKKMQVIMIVGEGTVFLLLLLVGIYKIKQSVDKEQQLANQQRNFFLSITHEFKTPIAATKLQIQTLLKHKLEPEQQNDLLTKALNETERLNVLIENLLFASQLDSGQFTFKKEQLNLSEFVTEVCQRYYSKEVSSGILKLDLEVANCQLDRHAFTSVITNLIQNAIKYTPDEKRILVSVRKQDNKVLLSVSDNGIGVSEQEKEKIFDRFYRSGNEETRTSKGTGLGLYITKFIMENHSGSIRVKPNMPKGSVFEIELNA